MICEERAIRVSLAMNVRKHECLDPEWREKTYHDLLEGKMIIVSSLRTHLIGDSFASVFGYLRINPALYEDLRRQIFVDPLFEGRCKDV